MPQSEGKIIVAHGHDPAGRSPDGGRLVALFERAVGLYASLVGINAYHPPGVAAGKKAAASILTLQGKILAALSTKPQTAEQIAGAIGESDSAKTVDLLLEHLAANLRAVASKATDPGQSTFVRP